jgi:hypothetical protein
MLQERILTYTGAVNRLFRTSPKVTESEFMGDSSKTDSQILLNNPDKLHTTELGALRIRRNLGLTIDDVIAWCRQEIAQADEIARKGKNWYVVAGEAVITANAHSCTVITAHRDNVKRGK